MAGSPPLTTRSPPSWFDVRLLLQKKGNSAVTPPALRLREVEVETHADHLLLRRFILKK